MMFRAVGAAIEQADIGADGLEIGLVERIAKMVQHRLVERHMALERVRAQPVGGENIVDLPARSGDAVIERLEASIRLVRPDCPDPAHGFGR